MKEDVLIIVKYPDGRTESRTFVIVSGENPIGSARPLPDGSTLEIMDGCIEVTAGESASKQGSLIWPWDKITELNLGPKIAERVILMEQDSGGAGSDGSNPHGYLSGQ